MFFPESRLITGFFLGRNSVFLHEHSLHHVGEAWWGRNSQSAHEEENPVGSMEGLPPVLPHGTRPRCKLSGHKESW
jgi:hypothetical protein